jgi:ParB/RepB/Spo0J family partition protein
MSKKKDFSQIVDFTKKDIDPGISKEEKRADPSPHVIDSLASSRPVIRNIEVDKIVPSQSQPRKTFHETSLQELADSIKEKGLLQEIAVKRAGEGRFEIIWGERRWRACKMLGWKSIPSRIYDERNDSDELSLIENIQRDDLLPEEFSVCVKNILAKKGYSQNDMAHVIGKSQGTISKCLSIAAFAADPLVSKELMDLRKKGNSLNFELLFLASSQGSMEEGLEFLKNALRHKIPTKMARKITANRMNNTHSTAKKLKTFRSRLDFSYLEAAPREDPDGMVKKEIDLTIEALNKTLDQLRQVRNSII